MFEFNVIIQKLIHINRIFINNLSSNNINNKDKIDYQNSNIRSVRICKIARSN